MPPLPVVLSHCQSSNRGCCCRSLVISLPPLLLHGNAPPNPAGNNDEDDNEDNKEDDNEDEGDVTTTFDEVTRCLQGDSYLAERAGVAVMDQPVTTHPTNRMLMSLLAAATMAIDNKINGTMTSTSRDELIDAMITPLDEGPKSNQGGGIMSEVAILEGREDAIPRGGVDDDNAIVASDNSKCK